LSAVQGPGRGIEYRYTEGPTFIQAGTDRRSTPDCSLPHRITRAAPSEVAGQVVKVVDTLKGSRPFRVFVDPAAEDVFRMGDRVRQWFYQRIGMLDLVSVGSSASPKSTG